MPLTAAERQRKYREKLKSTDPEKFKEQKTKNSQRTLRLYRQKTANYTEEQKEELRRKWREARNSMPSITEEVMESVPHSSSGLNIANDPIDRKTQRNLKYKSQNDIIKLRLTLNGVIKGFRNLRRKVDRQKKEMDKMKEQYESIIRKLKDIPPVANAASVFKETTDLTPRKRVDLYINETIPDVETPKKREIKKKLLEHNVLEESFKNEYKKSSCTDKKILKRIVNSDISKKYKQMTKLKYNLGLKSSSYKARQERAKKTHEVQKKVISFYNRDDVSRATAGKKEYRTFKRVKCQKRYLLDNLKLLHKKYVAEEGKLSFSTFKKYRPFYVLPPKIKDCETCACIKHSNMQFVVDELRSFGILQNTNLNEVVSTLVCDLKSKNCMYGDCTKCIEKTVEVGDIDPDTDVNWYVWALQEYEYGKPGNTKKSRKMMKIKKEGTLKALLEIFNNDMKAFKKHVFNFYFQYDQYKSCINNITNEEVVIHIDFSENYTCKYNKEVQATHFVKNQITLHTGVLYMKNENPISFCSISPDNQHNPESIWAHLDPILNFVKSADPNINVIHFFSDGPTTQYRQKKNFYLFSQNIYDYGFNYATWSFFEAAHGKGAADGVGGAIKRTLDTKIAQGQDIPDAQAAYDALLLTDTTIKIFYIPAENIQPLDAAIVQNLTPLPGTMKIHQLMTPGKYKLKYRDLSCFCKDSRGKCECHSPVCHDFTIKNNPQHNRKRRNTSETNENMRGTSTKTKVKRRRRDPSSSTEEDINTCIEYAESEASGFLSDISMSSDVDSVENKQYELDEKTGIFRPRIDPNKKIDILSTEIIKKSTRYLVQKPKEHSQVNLTTHGMTTSTQDRTITKNDDVIDETDQKVTLLAEVRHSAENIAFIDLRTSEMFSKEQKNNAIKKENFEKKCGKENTYSELNYSVEKRDRVNPVTESDSTIKKGGILRKIENRGMEKINVLDKYKTTKDENISIWIEEQNISRTEKVANEETNTTDDYEINKDEKSKLTALCGKLTEKKEHFDTSGSEKDDLDETNKHETEDDSRKTKNYLEELTNDDEDQIVLDYKVDETVIVRYYQRKQWKYYIGYITHILDQDKETQYKIRFLKTVKNPSLKFIATKKLDIDIVPRNSIVKRVNLIPQNAKEYCLENDFDKVYF